VAKLILIAIAVWLLITIIKRYQASINASSQTPASKAQDMVQCAHCGVHLPQAESVTKAGKVYCSEQHANQ
jgi:uncharacterized protein